MDELNFEINLHRQLIKGNKYQVASFENVILLMQKQLEVQLEKNKYS